jgi:hypothetical protein
MDREGPNYRGNALRAKDADRVSGVAVRHFVEGDRLDARRLSGAAERLEAFPA